jgi:hypothetical protein
VVAEKERTRALLASQQDALSAALERNAVRLAGFSVDVGGRGGSNAPDPGADDFAAGVSMHGAPHPVRRPPASLDAISAELLPGGRLSLRV